MDQLLNIRFTGDVSQLTKAFNQAESELTSFESKLKESLGADAFSQISSQIDGLRNKFSTLSSIDIKADPSQALSAVESVLADIAKLKSSEVLLRADNTQALAAIEQIESLANDIKVKISVDSSSIDTTKLQNLFNPISEKIALNVSTQAAQIQIKSLLADISSLKGKDILININGTEVVKTIEAIEKELLQLQSNLRTATNPKDIAKLNQSLIQIRSSLSLSPQFQKLQSSSNSATFALTNLGRVAQDLPFGFIGIANNLNPLLESFQRLKAETGSTGTALKALGSSLLGAGGVGLALSAVTAILTISQLGFSAWTRGFGNAAKGAGEAAKQIRSATQVIGDSIDGTQGDIAKVNALVSAFANTDSLEKQKRIIEDLKKTNESYFGELKAGVSTLDDITKATEAYSQALIQQAIVKGLQEEISELSKQLRTARKEYRELNAETNAAKKNLNEVSAAQATNVQGLTGQNQKVNLATNAYNALNVKLNKSFKSVNELTKGFSDLTDEIQSQVAIGLNLKPLDKTKPTKELKDLTDDIIAKARQFAKEFGNAFVVPDLEDSFFKTKKQILEASKKLLDDIKNNKLKVKLPVLTEFDLIPESSLTQSQIDNFFKSSGKDLEIPIGFKVDPSLFKSAIDDIDKKLDFRKQFSVLGDLGLKEFSKLKDVDFKSINGGLSQASKTLQGMLEIANTLNQSIGQGLAGAFNAAFDAALEGKNVFKALGEGLKQLVIGTIKAIAQMLILKAITNLLFPGSGFIPGIRTGGAGQIAAPSFGLGSVGGRAAPSLVAQVRGTDLQFILTQGANQIGRVG